MGLPVVPVEACRRTMSFIGLANRPNGYVSRKSVFTVNGSFATSSSDRTSSGSGRRSSMRLRNSAT